MSSRDEPRTAWTAAHALGEIGCAGACDALVAQTLPKKDPEMRIAATAGPSTDTPPPDVAVAHRKARTELIDGALKDLLAAVK